MKQGLIIAGAGGHAKVVIELFREMGREISYCVGGASDPADCLGVKVLQGDANFAELRSQGYQRAFVAIGSNERRLKCAEELITLGFVLENAVSARSAISPSARLGKGIAVMAGAIINASSVVDDLAIVNTGATVDHDCHLGIAVHIAPQCALAGNVVVGAGAFLGIGAIVVPQVRIGAGAMVGAGAVVTRNVEDGATMVGVPARRLQPK